MFGWLKCSLLLLGLIWLIVFGRGEGDFFGVSNIVLSIMVMKLILSSSRMMWYLVVVIVG